MSATALLSRLTHGWTTGILLLGAQVGAAANDADGKPSAAASFRDYKQSVLALAFTADGKTLATAGGTPPGEVVLWDAKTTQRRITLKDPGILYALDFSPDGKLLAGCGMKVLAWNGAAPPLTAGCAGIWDAVTGKELFAQGDQLDPYSSVAFSADGKTVAMAGSDRTVAIWETRTGKVHRILTGHKGKVLDVAFAPDGKTLATAGADCTVKIWNLTRGKVQATLEGHKTPVLAVAFAPDGRTLVSGGGTYDDEGKGELKLWDVASGKEKANSSGHPVPVLTVAFSPDGKTFASGSRDGTVKLWDADKAREKWTQKAAMNLTKVRFSPDSKLLATADGTGDLILSSGQVRLWYVANGKEKLSAEAEAERDRREAEEQRLQAEEQRVRAERARTGASRRPGSPRSSGRSSTSYRR